MGRLILVTGGARSGKSTFAEELAKKQGNEVIYVATSIPFDDEMKQRVKKHREQRPSHWETVEAYKDMDLHLSGRLEGKSCVLLDCITVMVTNIMFEMDMNWDSISVGDIELMETRVKEEVEKLIMVAEVSTVPFVVVTNEVGMGIVPENALARAFRDIAGRVNQTIAKVADEVHLCVSGISVRIK